MNKYKKFYIFLTINIIGISWSTNAFAYIDPGSTSAIITAILGFLQPQVLQLINISIKLRNFF